MKKNSSSQPTDTDENKPNPGETNASSQPDTDKQTPTTGDDSRISLWLMLLILSSVVGYKVIFNVKKYL